MRATVDERLSSTLEQRLGESFKLVSERLKWFTRVWGNADPGFGGGDLKRSLPMLKLGVPGEKFSWVIYSNRF